MKKIIITEKQYKFLIGEAAMDGFNPYDITRQYNIGDKYEYCCKYLGEPIGEGSSRSVFQIDDDRVLKLSIDDPNGKRQNKLEWDVIAGKRQSDLFPKGFYAAKNYSWIIVEYVIPLLTDGEDEESAKKSFLKLSGVPFDTFCDFAEFVTILQKNDSDDDDIEYDDEYYSYYEEKVDMLKKQYPYLNKMADYMNYYHITEGDLTKLEHYGMVNRDGKTLLVLLDFGLNYDIWKEFYS